MYVLHKKDWQRMAVPKTQDLFLVFQNSQHIVQKKVFEVLFVNVVVKAA